jgi:hypothetical protein
MNDQAENQSQDQLSRALARDLQIAYTQTREMDFDGVVEALKSLENAHVASVGGNHFLALETKRRVAELLLDLATCRLCPFETVRDLLDDLFRLGFTDLERKGTMCLVFSRYCQDTGRNQEAIDLLEHLKAELEEESARTGLEVYRDLVENTEVVLKELQSSERGTS